MEEKKEIKEAGEIKNIEEKPEEQKEISLKEERIRKICSFYYSRPDIRKAMFEFSKNRECIPRYFEGFGKRPDAFQYDSDIAELAKNGATSFHCSEELWRDPLEISTEMSEEDTKKLRVGWDLIIDVDSPYLDYSKIYAEILIEVLQSHGIKNIGVKFSGSKGWHIIIPFKAFPEQMSGKKTREMFPEWPRLICQYLGSKVSEKMKNRVLDLDIGKDQEKKQIETYCTNCDATSEKKSVFKFTCPSCKTLSQLPEGLFEKKRKLGCSNCLKDLTFLKEKEHGIEKEEFFFCQNCKHNSRTNPERFKERLKSQHIAADLILVSPRHLFRMPYSLHEKTSLASIVIPKEKIKDFELKDANPMKAKPVNFIPESEPGEASMLLRSAVEFRPPENKKLTDIDTQNKNFGSKKFKDITIKNLTPDLYPPSIKQILEGMKTDGRKRALFILLSFFKSLKLSDEEIQKQVDEWNAKNHEPLKSGYIKSQIMWYSRQKQAKLPPNFDKSYYSDIGITPSREELAAKNPVSWVIKKSLSRDYFKNKNYTNKK